MCPLKSIFLATAMVLFTNGAHAHQCDDLTRGVIEEQIDSTAPFAVLTNKHSLSRRCVFYAFYYPFDRSNGAVSRYYVARQLITSRGDRELQVTDRRADSRVCASIVTMVNGLSDIEVPKLFVPGLTPTRRPKTITVDGTSYDVWFRSGGGNADQIVFGRDLAFSSSNEGIPSVQTWWRTHADRFEDCMVE